MAEVEIRTVIAIEATTVADVMKWMHAIEDDAKASDELDEPVTLSIEITGKTAELGES